jgi:hypothetical protein
MYIFYKIYLQWIYWTLFFIARCFTIFVSELPEGLPKDIVVEYVVPKMEEPVMVVMPNQF